MPLGARTPDLRFSTSTLEPHLAPKGWPRTAQSAQRCQKGGQKLTFRSPNPHIWVPKWREWPLAKTSAGAMFTSHNEGPGPSIFAPGIALGAHHAPGGLFSTLWALLWVPGWAPGRPKGARRVPVGGGNKPFSQKKQTILAPRGPGWAQDPSGTHFYRFWIDF